MSESACLAGNWVMTLKVIFSEKKCFPFSIAESEREFLEPCGLRIQMNEFQGSIRFRSEIQMSPE